MRKKKKKRKAVEVDLAEDGERSETSSELVEPPLEKDTKKSLKQLTEEISPLDLLMGN